MRIELLGDNCRTCRRLKINIERALQGVSANVELQDICDPQRFVEYGLLSLPGLAVDGKLKSEGQLLSTLEILSLLGKT